MQRVLIHSLVKEKPFKGFSKSLNTSIVSNTRQFSGLSNNIKPSNLLTKPKSFSFVIRQPFGFNNTKNDYHQNKSFDPNNIQDWSKILASSGALALVIAYLYLNDYEFIHAEQQPSLQSKPRYTQNEVHFVYKVRYISKSHKERIDWLDPLDLWNLPPIEGLHEQTMLVGIGEDYFYIDTKAEGNHHTVMWFDLATNVMTIRNDNQLHRSSVFAPVVFLFEELKNQIFILKTIKAAGGHSLDYSDLETKAHILAPTQIDLFKDIPKSQYDIEKTSETLTTFTPVSRSTEQVRSEILKIPIVMTLGQKEMFYKFLLYSVNIHPLVLDELDKQLNLRGKGVAYSLHNLQTSCSDFMETTFTNYRLDKCHTAPQTEMTNDVLNGEIPKGFEGYSFGELDVIFKHVWPDRNGKVPTLEHLEMQSNKFFQNAVKSNNIIDAYLAFIESIMQSDKLPLVAPGIPFDSAIMKQWAAADPRIIYLNNALYASAMSDVAEEQIKQLIETVSYIGAELKSPKSYVVHILIGNLYQQLDQNSVAAQHFLEALKGNPYLAPLYKDLGESFFLTYETMLAWYCFDAARKLNPNHKNMQQIAHIESIYKKSIPQFFLK